MKLLTKKTEIRKPEKCSYQYTNQILENWKLEI